jgi:hypothetical protein
MLIMLALPTIGHAYFNIDPAQINTCVYGKLACSSDLAGYLAPVIEHARWIAFTGLVGGALVYYALKLLFGAENENTQTETKQAIAYIITAAILVYGASTIAQSFATVGSLNPGGVNPLIRSIITFLQGIIAAILIANIAIQGFRMITATDDGAITKGKTRFIHGIVGAAIVILASPIVTMVFGRNAWEGVTQIVGVANFLITIFGFLAAAAIMIAGFMYVISADEGFKEKAKKLIVASVTALVIVIAAGALINIFILA